jgi:hypothetical protein
VARLKGSRNKITSDLKQRITDIVEKELEGVESLLSGLSPKDKASFLLGLMSYVVSKPKAEQQITLDTLSESQSDALIKLLLEDEN